MAGVALTDLFCMPAGLNTIPTLRQLINQHHIAQPEGPGMDLGQYIYLSVTLILIYVYDLLWTLLVCYVGAIIHARCHCDVTWGLRETINRTS